MALKHRPALDTDQDEETVQSPVAVLELLDDPFTQSILAALDDGDKPARSLVESCEGSRPTVYRRLDRLEEAGVVESHTALHPDGHHRKEYALVVDELTLQLTGSGFEPS